jgi:hypothetical protein
MPSGRRVRRAHLGDSGEGFGPTSERRMSGTYLHIMSPAVVAETNALIDSLRSSREAFDALLTKVWGEVRYPHERFVRDCATRTPSGWEIYYLAHELVNGPKDVPSLFMDVEMHLLFLDTEWMKAPAETREPDLAAFHKARSVSGFRITPGRSTESELAALEGLSLPPAVRQQLQKRIAARVLISSEDQVAAVMRDHGLSDAFARDVVLLNRLCGYRMPAAPRPAGDYPVWVVAGWDNYEGHLTAAELATLNVHDPSGYLALFSRAVAAGPENQRWQAKLVSRLLDVRERTMALGPDALCLAIRSQ